MIRRNVAVAVSTILLALPAVAQLASSALRLRVKPNVSFTRREWEDALIPVAGSTAGSLGTFFKSDMYVANYRDVAQLVRVTWLPQGQNNVNAPYVELTIPANSFLYYDDFVATALGKSGLGAVWFRAYTSGGQIDSDAKLDVVSRVWTKQPGSEATVSQALPATRTLDFYSDEVVYVLGLRQDENFRTNVGVVNWDKSPRTFTVDVSGTRASTQFTFTAQPFGFSQSPLPTGNFGAIELTIRAEQNPSSRYFWTAYGTSVDNRSGDGWVLSAMALENP